jgi:hypothetical protein
MACFSANFIKFWDIPCGSYICPLVLLNMLPRMAFMILSLFPAAGKVTKSAAAADKKLKIN